jgi:trehalose utilization protein
MIRTLVWNEYLHEKDDPRVGEVYPDGIHNGIASGLRECDAEGRLSVATATMDLPEQGLSAGILDATDVMLWWGHRAHHQVDDSAVERVRQRVLDGMGLIVLHSSHFSKIFISLMGTECTLRWREDGGMEKLWVADPNHPIARGVDECIELPNTEMYGEPFDIPAPEEQVFVSWFAGGEVFRSGNCWTRGKGRVFYFRPGHETYPIYHHPQVRKVLYNAVLWAAGAS